MLPLKEKINYERKLIDLHSGCLQLRKEVKEITFGFLITVFLILTRTKHGGILIIWHSIITNL